MGSDKVQWVFDSICKRDSIEWLRLLDGALLYTKDGGARWLPISWKMTLPSHIRRTLHRAAWPPPLDCYGWFQGHIAVAWHYQGEEDFLIGKYMAILDRRKARWVFRFIGTMAQADDTLFTWYEGLGFEQFTRIREVLDENMITDTP